MRYIPVPVRLPNPHSEEFTICSKFSFKYFLTSASLRITCSAFEPRGTLKGSITEVRKISLVTHSAFWLSNL